MKESYAAYKKAGCQTLPTKKDKSPLLAKPWQAGFSPEEFEGAHGIGVICGAASGGLECIDFDNHFGDAKDLLMDFLSIAEVGELYEKKKIPIEKTVGGGYHMIFRSPKPDGNRKLARRINASGRPEVLIETRGEGGYFVAYPSPGYKLLRNDIFKIPMLTKEERESLISVAMSFNEYTQQVLDKHETKDRPGDVYNEDPASVDEMISLLLREGWVRLTDFHWRRPGKKDGVSATLGKVARGVFYVFSTNAHPFDSDRAYSPFQVLALLEFGGDFSLAASDIASRNKERHIPAGFESKPVEKDVLSDLDEVLMSSKIDTSKDVERPPTILSFQNIGFSNVKEQRMFTLGNFSCIFGKAKTKKTFLISLLTAHIVSPAISRHFVSSMPAGKGKILYFDTEQGEYDCKNTIKRIETMTGIKDSVTAFSLRQFSPKDRCRIIDRAFELYGDETGFCVIDGIADLANAINDEDEATRVVTMLLRLTKVHNCHITTVIHQNKGDNYATGHLGSSVMKKAEMLIAVSKTSEPDISDISCDMSRGPGFNSFGMEIVDGLPEVVRSEVVEKIKTSFEVKKDPEQFSVPF